MVPHQKTWFILAPLFFFLKKKARNCASHFKTVSNFKTKRNICIIEKKNWVSTHSKQLPKFREEQWCTNPSITHIRTSSRNRTFEWKSVWKLVNVPRLLLVPRIFKIRFPIFLKIYGCPSIPINQMAVYRANYLYSSLCVCVYIKKKKFFSGTHKHQFKIYGSRPNELQKIYIYI